MPAAIPGAQGSCLHTQAPQEVAPLVSPPSEECEDSTEGSSRQPQCRQLASQPGWSGQFGMLGPGNEQGLRAVRQGHPQEKPETVFNFQTRNQRGAHGVGSQTYCRLCRTHSELPVWSPGCHSCSNSKAARHMAWSGHCTPRLCSGQRPLSAQDGNDPTIVTTRRAAGTEGAAPSSLPVLGLRWQSTDMQEPCTGWVRTAHLCTAWLGQSAMRS